MVAMGGGSVGERGSRSVWGTLGSQWPTRILDGADGSFEIKGVPIGDQNLVVWQAKVGYVNAGLARGMKVTVKADGTDLGAIKLDPAKVK